MHRPPQPSSRDSNNPFARIELDSEQTSADEAIHDGVVTARIKMKLLAHSSTASSDLHVETHGGVVQLSGFASTTDIHDVAMQLAEHVDGVRQVVDNLDVRRTD